MRIMSTRKKVGPQGTSDGTARDVRWTQRWKHFDCMREMKVIEKK
jgi:hypothetical protein